jgi:Phospholipase_D-nuclease N-terminal
MFALGSPTLITALLVLVILLLDVRIVIYFLKDLYQPERRVYGGDKQIWAAIIVFGSVLGWIAYLSFGRQN